MNASWYPKTLAVGADGTVGTYDFMKTVFARQQHFCYAEFGIYKADTARHVCELFSNACLYLFDFSDAIEAAKAKLHVFENKIFYYGNSERYNDSYNWSLMKLIASQQGNCLFDYCFLDGAHTVAIDALNFFLCDRLLKVGGYMDFDDYTWRLRGSSLDPARVPAVSAQYTDEQVDAYQVQMIVDELVRRDARYKEVVPSKVFQKIAP